MTEACSLRMHVGTRMRKTPALSTRSMLPAAAAAAQWLRMAFRSPQSDRGLRRCKAMRRIG
jgi:hypothetical protein